MRGPRIRPSQKLGIWERFRNGRRNICCCEQIHGGLEVRRDLAEVSITNGTPSYHLHEDETLVGLVDAEEYNILATPGAFHEGRGMKSVGISVRGFT